ncbi:short-chain dehydrogenase reductase [Paraphaeosphaeria sporulosa]
MSARQGLSNLGTCKCARPSHKLNPALRNPETLARITKLLRWLLALGLVRTVNKKLNQLALNAGIGLLTVKRLILKGVKVAILDIQQLPPALQVYASIRFFVCDIADPEAVASTAEKVRATMGSPSILVNNPGITHPHTILKTSPEFLRKIFDVNLLSNWYTIQAFLPDI